MSAQLLMSFIGLAQFLILALVEGHFFHAHLPRADRADLFSIRPEKREDAAAADALSQVQEARVARARDFHIGQKPEAEGVLETFLNFLRRDLVQVEWCVEPIEFHL